MNYKQHLVMLTTVAVLTSGTTLASEIYRYTDAEGNVHYVDRPTGAATEQRLAISSKPTNPSQVQARVESRRSNSPSSNPSAAASNGSQDVVTAEGAAEEKKLTRAEKKAARREQEQKCQSYRDQMETLVTSRRLFRQGDDGEREYLDESQTQAARDKVQALIEDNCG